MSKTLNPDNVLVFYDEPIVFTAKDNGEASYLCMLISTEDNSYVAIRVTNKNISDFTSSRVDLRSLFLNPVMGNEYFLISASDQNNLIITDTMVSIEESMLPEPGFYIGEDILTEEPDVIDSEFIKLNSPIIHLGIVDSENSHSIPLDRLSLVSDKFQSMIRRMREKIDPSASSESSELRMFASSAASFNLHLEANAQPDMFGVTDIDHTLEFMHELLSVDSDDRLVEILDPIRGHASRSFRAFLEALRQNELSIKWKIKISENKPTLSNKMPREAIERNCNILARTERLDSVISEFRGEVLDAKTTTGDWRIALEDNPKKHIVGRASNPKILKGVKMGGIYCLKCEETIISDNVSKKELVRYNLIKIKKARKGRNNRDTIQSLFK